MPDLQFSVSIRFIFLFLAVLCSIGCAIIFYRITIPPVSSAKRILLISLRSAGLFFLFFIICEPLLSIISHSVEQPVVAVLVDNSKSMDIQDRTERRDKVLKSVLNSNVWQQINNSCKLEFALFDRKVRYLTKFSTDSITFGGESTDISEALKSVKNVSASSNLQAVVIISDGNSTTGVNPVYEAEELGVPAFTIGVGDTIDQKDLLVRKVLTNDITYVGTKVPVNATIHSTGYDGEHVQISLHDSTMTIDQKILTLEKGTHDYNVQLSLVPKKEGLQKYTIEVSSLPGELTLKNNKIIFFTKVLKSKLNVILIAGAPSQDVSFICRALKSDNNIEMKSFIERNTEGFYENILTVQMLRDVDCFILVGFPSVNSNSRFLQILLEAADAGKPFMVILSRSVDFEKLQTVDRILPFNYENVAKDEIQIFTSVPETQRNNPILKIGSSLNTIEIWGKLPPIFQPQGTFQPKIESQLLVTGSNQSMSMNSQLIVSRHINKKKSIAVIGYGLWRWKMLSDAGSETEQVLENFIGNSIRWLTTEEDERRIRVQPTEHIYSTQDPVEFTAQVYNENYQPIDDAQVDVRVQHGKEINSLILNTVGSGQYQSAYGNLMEGDYIFKATVTLGGTVIGADEGTFSIGGLNTEYLETRMNKLTLEQIASHTGGRYYESDNFKSLMQDIGSLPNFKSKAVSRLAEIEIWNSRWMLILIILIFTIEWFLRKQNGML